MHSPNRLVVPGVAGWGAARDHWHQLRHAGITLTGWLVLLLAVVGLPALHFSLAGWVNVALHTLLETVSIIVSALVFSVGWHTFTRDRSCSVALVCNAFLGVALLDFVHLLTFEGMPPMLTPSGAGMAISFFLAARALAAVALLGIAALAWDKRIDSARRNWLVALCLGFAIAVAALGLLQPGVKELFFVPGRGLTPLKIGIEYGLIAGNLAAAVLFLRRMREPQAYPAAILFRAACMAALSEACFTLYASTVDQYNVLGHFYKVIAYLLVYRALFVTLVKLPYQRLELAQRELQGSEERYRMLFEANRDGLLLIRPDGSLQAANQAACALFGMTREQLLRIGSDAVDGHAGRQLKLLFTRLWRAGQVDGELTLQRADGSSFAAEVSCAVYVDNGGQQAAVTVVRDISDRKKAQEEIMRLNLDLERRVQERTAHLEAANHELDSFCYSVSHDLRAPLRAIDGFSRTALDRYGDLLPEQGRHYLERARVGAQRMGQLIDSLLEFSRAGRTALHLTTVHTDPLVRDCINELQHEYPGRRIELKIGTLPDCRGDIELLRQVWMNLLGNAFKYTGQREAACIEVEASVNQGQITYSVRDNGTGFDMADAGNLFGVFQRLHTEAEFPGVGVGLALVQRIVNRHGGRLWAQAQPDQGAAFSFTLESAS